MPRSIRDAGPYSDSSRRPHARTSLILSSHKVQKYHLLHATTLEPGFVWDDFLIPYSKGQLPKDEDGSLDYADDFIEEQKAFLLETSQKSIQDILTRHPDDDRPPHIQVKSISEVLQLVKPLGSGRSGQVHEVKMQASDGENGNNRANVFAAKIIRKPAPREGNGVVLGSTVAEFKTELENLSRCRHHHLIDLRASFTDETNFGFIMSPVAKSTLQKLLGEYTSTNDIYEHQAVSESLFDAFGCLLNALCYLHEELKIRHRDIKPRNILMHGHRVLICDLGSAYDFESLDRNESTETSRPPGTRKYKAPEVLESIGSNEVPRHNSKADIFSLGCVFLEIHTVLCERTLDRMAKFITQNERNDFEGEGEDWNYASSLERAYEWLEEIRDSQGRGEGPTSLIRSMICKERSERESAQKLSQEVCTKYHRYIGDCCRRNFPSSESTPPPIPSPSPSPSPKEISQPLPISSPPSSPEITPPLPSPSPSSSPESLHDPREPVPRPITSCKFGRRESVSGFPRDPNYGDYGDYVYSADDLQEGQLEIREDRGSNAWATTRTISVKMMESPRSIEEHWLPAYYVNVTRNRRKITIEWSDCDQLVKERENGRLVSSKIHCSTSSRNNLIMKVRFREESDAADFARLLLGEPTEGHVRFKVNLSENRILTVRDHSWRYANEREVGSHVICLQQSLSSTHSSRVEPLFVTHDIDFILPLGEDQRYTKLGSESFWVPRYRSNKERMYERPGKATFKSVELAPLQENYFICFEEGSEASYDTTYASGQQEEINHVETTAFCNKNLQQFLSILTGWNLLVIFAATDVQPKRRKHFYKRGPRARPADVLCFRKGREETRVAIRMKNAEEEYTISWTSAKLVKVDVNTEIEELCLTLQSRRTGQKLTLATVTAADTEKKKDLNGPETWVVKVASGSGELRNIIN